MDRAPINLSRPHTLGLGLGLGLGPRSCIRARSALGLGLRLDLGLVLDLGPGRLEVWPGLRVGSLARVRGGVTGQG